MKSIITEEDLENFSIEWFKEIGYQFAHGPDIAPDSTSPERDDFRNCSDSDQYPLNLMLFLGLPKDDWEKYYFQSLQDIKSNKKGFVEWAIK